MTKKGKMDTNSYLFEWVNCSLSIRFLFKCLKKICSKRLTNHSNSLHIHLKYISIHSNSFCNCSPLRGVRSENCSIRSTVWCLFCSSAQKENIALISLQILSIVVEMLQSTSMWLNCETNNKLSYHFKPWRKTVSDNN